MIVAFGGRTRPRRPDEKLFTIFRSYTYWIILHHGSSSESTGAQGSEYAIGIGVEVHIAAWSISQGLVALTKRGSWISTWIYTRGV
jgi:hypothetical protein